MGFFLSKFRKKKTTKEQLESIEQKIRSIEQFQKETELTFRRVIGKLLFSSILVYIAAVIGYYYYYSPETFRDNIIKFLPLLVFPIVIMFFRKLLTYYYRRTLSKNESTLRTLKTNKNKILEEVMDKETYKIAKEILEKYAPDQLSREPKPVFNSSFRAIGCASPPEYKGITRQLKPMPVNEMRGHLSQTPAFRSVRNAPSTFALPRLSLPRPILPHDRGVFDKLIDLIVGDGPGNRYALICKVCSSHNGMALKHEFEYLAFRCAYCMQWNPARKQKPQAPYLFSDSGSQQEKLDENYSANEEIILSENESESIQRGAEDAQFIEEKNIEEEDIEEKDTFTEEVEEKDFHENSCSQNDALDLVDQNLVPGLPKDIDFTNLQYALEQIDSDISSSAAAAPLMRTSSTPESMERQTG